MLRRAHRCRSKGQRPPTASDTNAPMPNIENLKKQAKQYQRWHRERYYPVAAQIRAVLPRFRNVGDVQILESSFRLADAWSLSHGKWGSTGGRRSNQEQMP